jgi:DnaK suppressor protein
MIVSWLYVEEMCSAARADGTRSVPATVVGTLRVPQTGSHEFGRWDVPAHSIINRREWRSKSLIGTDIAQSPVRFFPTQTTTRCLMQKSTLNKYKQQLIELENRVSGDVDRLVKAIPDEVHPPSNLSNVPTHNADADVETFETDVELIRNEQDIHGKIHAALARIEDGSYGTCEGCGRPINPARLDAIPYATSCKDCAERAETSESSP